MRILYEDTMPHAGAYFSALGDASAYKWQTLTPQDLIDVDVLAVRSTTKVDRQLLSQANKLKYIATATAGTNHLDIEAISEKRIAYSSAAGCNAIAVAQYVLSALLFAEETKGLDLKHITVGIVGAGNVGTAVSKMLESLGISYLLCDPPIEKQDARDFVGMDAILKCDVISLHVPYVKSGEHSTGNMLDEARLKALSSDQWLINACRGEVIDETALLALKQSGKGPHLVLDVWANEPNISVALIPFVELATPHIAGHTLEGKVRGTQMVYDWLKSEAKEFFDAPLINMNSFMPKVDPIGLEQLATPFQLKPFLLRIYDIHFDHRQFVENMAQSNAFSQLRKSYRVRREYSAYTLTFANEVSESDKKALSALGFRW